jgi:hypothetical protein
MQSVLQKIQSIHPVAHKVGGGNANVCRKNVKTINSVEFLHEEHLDLRIFRDLGRKVFLNNPWQILQEGRLSGTFVIHKLFNARGNPFPPHQPTLDSHPHPLLCLPLCHVLMYAILLDVPSPPSSTCQTTVYNVTFSRHSHTRLACEN